MPIIKSSPRKFTDNILYELLVYSEWKQEPDISKLMLQHNSTDNQFRILSALKNPLQYLKSRQSLADDVTRLMNYQLPWQFAVGEDGKFIAILQENQLEIRTSKDEYSSIIGKATVAKDLNQQWRRLVWSPDCSMIAVGTSNGSVAFYDLLGSNLFNIPPAQDSHQWSCHEALTAILFISTRTKSPKWLSELVLVDYGGRLRSFYISPSEGCLEFHQTVLNSNGVSSVTWHPAHNLLIVSTVAQHAYAEFKDEPLGWGLSAWRLLNDHPHYRIAIPSSEQLSAAEGKLGLWSRISRMRSTHSFSLIFKMQASPNGQFMACLHTCGTISIWLLPSLRLHRLWALIEQPGYDIRNPTDKKKSKDFSIDDFLPLDLNWWSEEKIIISRKSGAVTVCNIEDLQNMLGDSPEFLCGEPRLSTTCDKKGFLALECESQLMSVKRGQQGLEPEDNNSSDEEVTFANKSTALVQSTVFMMTDLERFQPKKKRTKVLQRTYRLLGLRSTTPEELYTRKIDNEEFEEALALAEAYNLDVDRVFQRQWRNNTVSVETIYNYLSKISKTSWVLHECCERVPETLEAAKELIKFGLKCTDIEIVANSVLPDNFCNDKTDLNGEIESETKILIKEVSSIPIEDLPEDTKIHISTRKKLLYYSDILFTYELILNGMEANFDRDFYDKFRRDPVILSAIQYARASNDKAVDLLLTYLGKETLPHWLTILNNFPETYNPSKYCQLLPECNSDGSIVPWKQNQIRTKDWCESKHFKNLKILEADDYSDLPQPHEPLTQEVVQKWYKNRIYEIENHSHMVESALEMTKLAQIGNIKGLDVLCNELELLDILVYDVELEEITLTDLEKSTPLQKVKLLMSKSAEESFVENIGNRLLPYLVKLEKLVPNIRKDLFKEFLLGLSVESLVWPLKFFESKPLGSVVYSLEELILLAVECVYTYNDTDQFDNASAILDCLPEESTVELNETLTELYEKVSNAESELIVANILKKYNNRSNLQDIHKYRNDSSVVGNILLQIARSTGNRIPSATKEDWQMLLSDLLKMQQIVFKCISSNLCYEIYASSVLTSGNKQVIRSAITILCCHREDEAQKQLSLECSIRLVLQAAREYFDSSSSFTDKGIDLAKTCLHLISEDNNEIQEELDLISSLIILDEFGISLLPMQVRISSDRLKLINACLKSRPTAYKETQKLLSLAHKLRIYGNEKHRREGVVLVQIADNAFQIQDYDFCSSISSRLMDAQQAIGWEVCKNLGQCKNFQNLGQRQRLLTFSLLHCPGDFIKELMDTRCELEYEILQRYIEDHMSGVNTVNTSFEEDEFWDALSSPKTPTKDMLSQWTTKLQSTSSMLNKLTSTDFWKDKLKFRNETFERQIISDNSDMTRVAFPVFYSSLHPTCYESQMEPSYDTTVSNGFNDCEDKKRLKLTQALIQSTLLEQEKMPLNSFSGIDEALLQCSRITMHNDCFLAFSYLLSLNDQHLSEHCFASLPETMLSLQLAAYFYALSDAVIFDPEAVYWKPNKVLKWALKDETKGKNNELLVNVVTQISNFVEKKKLIQHSDVDANRFSKDAQYRYDSILSFAMNEDPEKLIIAFDLAAAHGVPQFEVCLTHIIYLFITSSFIVVMEKLADDQFLIQLKEQSEIVFQRFKENVWSNIAGTDYQTLISYFSVLNVIDEGKELNGLTLKDHIKLIKKVKATSSEIDYKSLVTQPENLLKTLRPAFNKDNINSLAKLLKTLPNHIRQSLLVNHLYEDWIIEQFKSQDLQDTVSLLKFFMNLCFYLVKLSSDDILNVVRNTIFSEQSIQHLDYGTRQEMMTVVLQNCQKESENNNWSPGLVKELKAIENHLLQVSMFYKSFPAEALTILQRLDTAYEDKEKMIEVLESALLMSTIKYDSLQALVKYVLPKETLTVPITRLLMSSHISISDSVNTILMRIEQCLNNEVKSDEWISLIESLTKQTYLEPQVRLKAVQLLQRLEKNNCNEVESYKRVCEAILGYPIEVDKVSTAAGRSEVFNKHISNATSWEDLCLLEELLKAWPQSDNNLYLELILSLFKFRHESLYLMLESIFTHVSFPEEFVQQILNDLDDNCDMIIICLLSKHKILQEKGLALFKSLPESSDIPIILPRLLVEGNFITSLVDCPIYSKFLETLINEDQRLCKIATDQLIAAGYLAEAGTLYLQHSFVPASLRTFSTAINILSRSEK